MKEAKFTKGPWFVDDWISDCGCLGSINTGSHYRAVEVVTSMIDDVIAGRENKELKANLYLISVAPDMYDLLSTIENDADQVPAWLWDKIQLTLAKARGEL